MQLKITFLFLIAFFSLFFLINECHDWVHFLVASTICGCFGTKGFENWTFCNGCSMSTGWLVFTWLSGPLLNYILIWTAWRMMGSRKNSSEKSNGLALLFAANPFARILAAISGGGDETFAMRQVFGSGENGHHHLAATTGLVLVLILTIPPLARAMLLLPGWKAKFLFYPALLYLPIPIDHWVMRNLLNPLLAKGILSTSILPGTPLLVMAWGIFWLSLFLFSYKNLAGLLRPLKDRKEI
jgi:hypothetical protein